jgi:hypothetical protein
MPVGKMLSSYLFGCKITSPCTLFQIRHKWILFLTVYIHLHEDCAVKLPIINWTSPLTPIGGTRPRIHHAFDSYSSGIDAPGSAPRPAASLVSWREPRRKREPTTNSSLYSQLYICIVSPFFLPSSPFPRSSSLKIPPRSFHLHLRPLRGSAFAPPPLRHPRPHP